MKQLLSVLALSLLCTSVDARVRESDLAKLKGYTILGAYTITGWYDPGKEKGIKEAFEGCDHGRVLILDNNIKVVCNEYNYSYAYRPDAIIFAKGSSFKMLVDGEFYDIEG